ncbi:MAG TPA: 4-hydroxythreonine-4-phosphate dehydrogenase PdxA [Gammaproteobacteria bacterium]|nr:4-hydroxythreonine-4-phosphate dehydrogenase PdxA [Gammaproteobacteria bacterium]HRF44057.1 4-hydroxythreonine-4-phosphate dehydrogenase PdxA [Candidatus Competibacteraceae bacterium]
MVNDTPETSRSIIGIPLGDIAGVGPEIVAMALAQPAIYETVRPLVVGEISALRRALRITGLHHLDIHVVSGPAKGRYQYGSIDLINLANIDAKWIPFGRAQAEAGRAAHQFIENAVELCQTRQVDALATTPINKEAFKAAGIQDIGHTELLGRLTGTTDPLTLFQVLDLKVFFLSRHVSLAGAIKLITRKRVLDYLQRCTEALKALGLPRTRLAVAGLNPHCGEHGLFGREEMRVLEPAIAEARTLGLDVTGPIAADSVFHLARQGEFDAVLSLYHDQGHIATKMVDFYRTIAITIGLPFIRTSVDHGTAFDLAGSGQANPLSMTEAIRLAGVYALDYRNRTMARPIPSTSQE